MKIAPCATVAVGVAIVGIATACTVTLFDFPGRKIFQWALLLPIAMPAYVVAYAYTDFLQYSGPAQDAIRAATGLQGRVLPEVRSLGSAVLVFVVTLYPYVYLFVRGALLERAAHLMEAARLLGAPLNRHIFTVALPLARPAVAAGVALALMETLAYFGVSSYFGFQTFTAGIYKAWLSIDNRIAAAHLACVLLGFVLPMLFMLRPLISGWQSLDTSPSWASFGQWTVNSLKLGAIAALLAVGFALALAFTARSSA